MLNIDLLRPVATYDSSMPSFDWLTSGWTWLLGSWLNEGLGVARTLLQKDG